ncbi:MAG: hypothetical protein ACRDD2_06675 [Sarcina sp.]
MKKKILVPIFALGVLGVGGSAMTSALQQTIPQNKTLLVSQNNNKANTEVAKKTSSKVGFNREYIESQLKAGKTVAEIKGELQDSFKTNINQEVTAKKLSQEKANEIITKYNYHMSRANILNGVVKNEKVQSEFNSGKTLSEVQQTLISNLKTEINQKVSQKKISTAKANEIEQRAEKKITDNQSIFENLGLIHQIQQELNKGETISQIKSNMIKEKDSKLESLAAAGKISKSSLAKREQSVEKRVNNLSEFKDVSTNGEIQKEINENENISTIKTNYINNLKSHETKVNDNSKLSSEQKQKINDHINKEIDRIQSGNIFQVTHSNR